MFEWIKNILTAQGWSFTLNQINISPLISMEGESVGVSSTVKNNGFRLGTVYVQVLISNSYDTKNPIFDSNKDLDKNHRQHLRLVDIQSNESRNFSLNWKVPEGSRNSHFDIKINLWNPHKLFGGPKPHKFYSSGWLGGFEVLDGTALDTKTKIFISYSWDSEEHTKWVYSLVQELRKFNIEVTLDQKDLKPGEQIPHFMEQAISTADACILICSANYVKKANKRTASGVGYETILTTDRYLNSSPKDRSRFIPIIRNGDVSKGQLLPKYLGSTLYINMEGDTWKSQPLTKLVDTIRDIHISK